LGLLGTGIAARKIYLPALATLKDRIRLVACANRTRSKAESFAAEAGIPRVLSDAQSLFRLPDLDAVLISLPIEAQPRYVLQALKAGLPVLSEKPVAPSLAAGRRLLAQALPVIRSGPAWMVAENFFFMPTVAWAGAILERGILGELRLVEVRQSGWTDASVPYYHTAWRRKPRFVGGFVLDAGVHLAHVLRRFLGLPVELRGLQALFNPSLPPLDTALAVLRFRHGAVGTWLSSFSAAADGPMITFRGTRASLELHWYHAVLRHRDGRERVFRSKLNSYSLQFRHFADAVLKNRRPAFSPKEALADLAFMESIVKGRLLKP
jgi:predicted dehydrogenase